MKDTIFEDYVLIKERIEFHCDKIIELLRLHSELIFKTKKGDKLKYDIMNHSSDIKNLLIRNMDNFHLKDDKYENFKSLSKAYVFIHDLEKDPNDLPEDDEKKGNEEVQELINKFNKVVEEKLKEKENELMTI